MEEKWFDSESLSEEEKDAIADEMLKELGRIIAEEEKKVSVINHEKCKQLLYAYHYLKHMARGTGAKVSYVMHEPFLSSGSVKVVGKDLKFDKPEYFNVAAKLANNIEAYPKRDGSVCVCFSFEGLTITAE